MKRLIYTFLAFFLLSCYSYGQEIKGNVSDATGPLPGVNIKSGSLNTVSDFDGNFTITLPALDNITFSMIGYETMTVKATLNMKVVLTERVNMIDEVVAIGYGTKKAGSITGSVTAIKAADITRTPAQSAIQAIQGKAAGINVVATDEPGANPVIVIRGLSTILLNRNPLYVIDGVEAADMKGISPNDIESFNILKDASSLAIYGHKGSNGVVIVTTKKGKKGDIKVSYAGYYGMKDVLKEVKMADSYRFAYFNNTAIGSTDHYNFTQPYNTNWFKEITQTGNVISNSVSLSGASDNTNYYLGLTNYEEQGVLMGTDFKRTNILNRNEYRLLGDNLKITHFVNLALSRTTPKPLSAFTNAYKQSPLVPVRYPNGRWGVPLLNLATGQNDLNGTNYDKYNNVGNPAAQLFYNNERNKNTDLTGSLAAELKILKDLRFTSNFGVVANWYKGYVFTPDRDIWYSQNPTSNLSDYGTTTQVGAPINTLQQKRGDTYEWNWDNYLTYTKEIGNHDFTVVAGMSRTTKNNTEKLNATRFNVPEQSNYWYLDLASDNTERSPKSIIENNHSTPVIELAYFGRFEYEYMKKYQLTAIFRREGSSAFQGNKKWGNFPSISAGWVISRENFMKGMTFIDNFKIRGGYGEIANSNGPTYNNVTFTSNSNYPFGNPPVIFPGSFVAFQPDQNLTWERMKEIDLGVDFSFMANRITGTFDYYNRQSDHLILPVSPPPVLSEGDTFINAGAVTNKGIELTLKWEDRINDNLRYWIGGNFSKNQNEVSRSDSEFFQNFSGSGGLNNGAYTKEIHVGEPIGSFYVFQQTGYNSDGAPVYNDMIDGVAGLQDTDRVNAGSYIPKYTYGFSVGFNYRNVDFSVDTYGVGGNKIYNGKKAQRFGGENIEYDILDDFYSPSNPNAENPKPSNEVPRASTYYVEDGSYLRINNITLGYTLPKMFDKLDKVRIYVTATNPFIFTKYTGYSPEIVGGDGNPLGGAGIELDAYPTNKTFVVGANINF